MNKEAILRWHPGCFEDSCNCKDGRKKTKEKETKMKTKNVKDLPRLKRHQTLHIAKFILKYYFVISRNFFLSKGDNKMFTTPKTFF